jgi:SNF2 family DNA or RNA helicase
LKIPILDDELMDEIAGLPEEDQRDYLFLSPHPELPGRWYVDSLHQGFFIDFEHIIGKYRTVSPATLSDFIDKTEEAGYKPTFTHDPFSILDAWDHLSDPPAFSLNSTMKEVVPGTGMLPFQLQGFNYLRKTPRGGIALWSTGTGKTALEAALIKQHLEIEDYDLAFVVCKKNNKIDTKKKLEQLGGIDYARVIDGAIKRRDNLWTDVYDDLHHGRKVVIITNYEMFKQEHDICVDIMTDRKVAIFWDEMPTKLSNRETVLYSSIKNTLYDADVRDSAKRWWDKRRAAELRQYNLSATPIENSPEGLLNQVRLLDPFVWPSIKRWEVKYGAGRDPYHRLVRFKDLDLMGLEIEHITHQADKDHPDIAKLFPKVQEETVYVDWSPEDRKVYDEFQKVAKDLFEQAKDDPEVKTINPLQLIGVLQMLCDAPSMVQKSAENRAEFEAILAEASSDAEIEEAEKYASGSEAALIFLESQKKPLTDVHCAKLDALCDLILKHKDEKVIVFSRLAGYIQPILEKRFEEEGITYVTYRGTDKQRQDAKERFKCDPDIQVFLSSDAGSDSIDLPEAKVNINYDFPLTYARKIQRRNRNHRVNSTHEFVIFYDLIMPDSVEERIWEILERKKGYHDEIFKGKTAEEAINARMTAEDLWYILTGEDLTDGVVSAYDDLIGES